MGSSWTYRPVAIRPYSIGGSHGLAHIFFTGWLVLYHRLAFRFDGRACEFTRRWKTTGSHRSKHINKSAQLAGPTFLQHFQTQVSPHYSQLDPIYYAFIWRASRNLVGKKWSNLENNIDSMWEISSVCLTSLSRPADFWRPYEIKNSV